MGFYFSCALAFLSVLVAANHAVLSPENYWKSTLPNTPMPKAVNNLLQPDEKTTTVYVGKGGGVTITIGDKPTGTGGSSRIRASHGTSGSSGNSTGSSGNGSGDNGSIGGGGSSNNGSDETGNSGVTGNNGNGNGTSGGECGSSRSENGNSTGRSSNGSGDTGSSGSGYSDGNNGSDGIGNSGATNTCNNGNRNGTSGGENGSNGSGNSNSTGSSGNGSGDIGSSGSVYSDGHNGSDGIKNSGATNTSNTNGNGSSRGGNASSGNGNGKRNSTSKGNGDNNKPKPPPQSITFNFNHYAAAKNQLFNHPIISLFFLEKEIHKGMIMNLHFVKTSNDAAFMPRRITEPIPFSSAKLPEILAKFSVAPGSAEADMIKETIEDCESPAVKGEEKFCPTSLEAMVDFIASKLGKNVEALTTELEKETGKQRYTVTHVAKKTDGENSVVCHKQSYVYAVFYCHASHIMKTFTVSLKAIDGNKVNAIAVCHTDTSAWNPKHVAFQFLKVNPGTPVCHFLPEEHIVWIPVKKIA